jgi:hypothetical protein
MMYFTGEESLKDAVLSHGWSIAAASELPGPPSIRASFEQSRRLEKAEKERQFVEQLALWYGRLTVTVGLRAEKETSPICLIALYFYSAHAGQFNTIPSLFKPSSRLAIVHIQ